MPTQPFFSVLIPAFNRAAFIKKCVGSALSQTFFDLEIVVVDDGSTDDTRDMVLSFSDPRLRYLRTEHRGVSHARNTAVAQAAGEFLAFLDSDDTWDKRKLEVTAGYISRNPDVKIFHTEEIWIKKGAVMKQLDKHKKPTGSVYREALPLCCIGMSTSVIHKSVFEDIGLFDENLEACEDYDLWLRACWKYETMLIPEALTIKDGGRPDQLSLKVWGLDRFRIIALEKILLSGNLTPELYGLTLAELRSKCEIFAAGCSKRGKSADAGKYLAIPDKYIKSPV
jgi:hypothetical protein